MVLVSSFTFSQSWEALFLQKVEPIKERLENYKVIKYPDNRISRLENTVTGSLINFEYIGTTLSSIEFSNSLIDWQGEKVTEEIRLEEIYKELKSFSDSCKNIEYVETICGAPLRLIK